MTEQGCGAPHIGRRVGAPGGAGLATLEGPRAPGPPSPSRALGPGISARKAGRSQGRSKGAAPSSLAPPQVVLARLAHQTCRSRLKPRSDALHPLVSRGTEKWDTGHRAPEKQQPRHSGALAKNLTTSFRTPRSGDPESRAKFENVFLDSGFTRHSASKTRVNALMGVPRNDSGDYFANLSSTLSQ
jgi:hypothetical protein